MMLQLRFGCASLLTTAAGNPYCLREDALLQQGGVPVLCCYRDNCQRGGKGMSESSPWLQTGVSSRGWRCEAPGVVSDVCWWFLMQFSILWRTPEDTQRCGQRDALDCATWMLCFSKLLGWKGVSSKALLQLDRQLMKTDLPDRLCKAGQSFILTQTHSGAPLLTVSTWIPSNSDISLHFRKCT